VTKFDWQRRSDKPESERRLRVAYVFTTFPLLSETPYQRELRALKQTAVELEIYSLWGGGDEFEGRPIQHFNKWRLISLLWLLPFWFIRKPHVFIGLAKRLWRARLPSLLNAGETLLGLAFAICHAGHFNRADTRPELFHAAWATLPATAVQLLGELTGTPFSMGAHAYDVFRHDGDWLLRSKLGAAALVVTSSCSTRERLLERGADPNKTVLIRRGLDVLPERRPRRPDRSPMRILSVGRLIEKKGYEDQIAIYAGLRSAGLSFEARIVGSGPLQRALDRQIATLGLSDRVALLGALPYDAVLDQYAWADVLLFTGKVARNGDRDGLPNVVPEAMALGVPVVARAAGGVAEAIEDGRTGILITLRGIVPWLSALKRLQRDDRHYEELCIGARSWVEANYDARKNVRALLNHFRAAVAFSALGNGLASRRPVFAAKTETARS
jgi:glycosyltransferase involved in cell wall biosynthesis